MMTFRSQGRPLASTARKCSADWPRPAAGAILASSRPYSRETAAANPAPTTPRILPLTGSRPDRRSPPGRRSRRRAVSTEQRAARTSVDGRSWRAVALSDGEEHLGELARRLALDGVAAGELVEPPGRVAAGGLGRWADHGRGRVRAVDEG